MFSLLKPAPPTKMMQGCSLAARLKVACTSFCVSPNHLLCSMLGFTFMKFTPLCFANACRCHGDLQIRLFAPATDLIGVRRRRLNQEVI